MIYQALKLLSYEVNTYLNTFGDISDDLVILGNISGFDLNTDNGGGSGNSGLDNKILLTLVNMQEEKSYKNSPAYSKQGGEVNYQNPPLNLNLMVLFSTTSTNYENALIYLSRILSFFQGKTVFTNSNTPVPDLSPQIENMNLFKFIADLYSPSFEEMNQLWATLGGKQFPSVLYKIRLAQIDRNHVLETRPVIGEIITLKKQM